ncbi:MAG: lipid A deacylase LpxR family protein [Deltaproteobacteria bacterium]|nr:lipid A deacylase LpxR family protein [Deltaproteobacteria bacterium]MBW1922013.1 lipid A deacylase LpxR family protein [Deltaproteobacteria bacterium]MBW1949195.1 lipid A deacylase LpxR family protein [Deltaproteobacteria bacterium]MBW2008178.1 lipid A deacylase LpxR family protein [Deltaproteobacteria bacterium]MBW2103173.1 lipid A deacylase LpxR family protein [Deltaproteobacteria bacterium]
MKTWTLLIVCFLFFQTPNASGSEVDSRSLQTVTLYVENDVFAGTDRGYTNGTKVSWISQDLSPYWQNVRLPGWGHGLIEKLPFINTPGEVRNVSLSVGQNMYTPEDLRRDDLIPDDRPYAGITYMSVGLHSKNPRRMDTLEFVLGLVGPHSYADEVQGSWHAWIDTTKPRGWKNQIQDEPVGNVFFERKWRLRRPEEPKQGWSWDAIPHLGLGVGNAFSGANLGAQFRFGWNLPDDFGTFLIRPGSDTSAPLNGGDPRFSRGRKGLGIHLFLAADGQAVARNIFLDGNTFRRSHSVDKEPFVVNFIAGVGVIFRRFKVSYAYVHRTKEFREQKEAQEYGSITVSYSF